jgi:SnoaL-like domain
VTSISADSRIAARLRLVDEHVRLENQHDLDGIMGTFGENARYHDQPWNAHYLDREQVRAFYADLLRALPDLKIEVRHRHPADEAIILELIVRGRHLSAWRDRISALRRFPVRRE